MSEDVFDGIEFDMEPAQSKTRLKELYNSANRATPDQYSKAVQVAGKAGLPVETALNMPSEAERKAMAPDWDAVYRRAPKVSAWMEEPNNFQQVHDDADRFADIEKLRADAPQWKRAGNDMERRLFADGAKHDDSLQASAARGVSTASMLWNALQAGAGSDAPVAPERQDQILAAAKALATGTDRAAQDAALAGLGEMSNREELVLSAGIYSNLPRDRRQEVAAGLWNTGEHWEALMYAGANPGILGNMLVEQSVPLAAGASVGGAYGGAAARGVTSAALGRVAPYAVNAMAAADVAGAGAGYVASNYAGNFGASYAAELGENIASGMSVDKAGDQAMASAHGEGAGNALMSMIPGVGGPLTRSMIAAAREGAGGALGAKWGNDAAGRETTGGEMFMEAIFGVASMPADYAGAAFGEKGRARMTDASIAQARAAGYVQNLKAELDQLSQTKTVQRAPKTALEALNAMDGDETAEVFINPSQILSQGAVPREVLLSAFPSLADQMGQAEESGGSVVLSRNELLVGLAANDGLSEQLGPHIKEDAFSPSVFEANQRAEEISAELFELADQQLAERANANELRQGREEVYQDILQQLDAAGLDKDGNKHRAQLSASVVTAMAARTGSDPMAVYKEQMGRITNERLQGEGLNQSAVPVELDALPDDVADDLALLYKEQGSDDNAFRLSRGATDNLAETVLQALPQSSQAMTDKTVLEAANIDAAENGAPEVTDVQRFDIMVPDKDSLGRQKETPAYVYTNEAGEVWVDLSELDPESSQGANFYSKVRDWADANGATFVGDPEGLSDNALLKRTEHMASAIARNKSTRSVAPHKRQLNPYNDKLYSKSELNQYILPLAWGKDAKMNERSVLQASFRNMLAVFPELKHATLDPRTGKVLFKGSPHGEGFKRFVSDLREGAMGQSDNASEGANGSGQPAALRDARQLFGSASVKRFLLANTAAQYPSSEGRRLVLAELGARWDDLVALDGQKVFYQNEAAPRGAFNPITRDIHLLTAADLSTFLHESGHLYLEMMVDMAQRDGASASLRADVDAALQWFGIEGDTAAARMEKWRSMSLNEQRPYHEQWAESFEQYLFEGKAPSMELRDAFRNFRQWLTHVYKSLAGFINSHGGAKLNDEMREVFGRMLATEEQIAEAEAARGMVPLFTVRPEGFTDAEWQQYKQGAEEATQTAIEQLTSRSLRDMKWLRNAKSKRIRELQREAAGIRREMRMEARKQVMSQPVYRAVQFLTAPVEGVRKAAHKARQSEHVDPSRDSLLSAIAKLGGLNKEQAVSQYGIDPADFHSRKGAIVGKPVLRKEGGLSPVAMAEALSQHGYLPLNEHGQWDIQDLDDLLREEAAGNPQYSTAADWDLLLGGEQYAPAPDADSVDYVGGRISRQAVREMFDDIDLQAILGEGAQDGVLNQAGTAGKYSPDLYVAHNLSESNLLHADEIGGLAAPSLGISRTSTGGFEGYGEITLLADKKILEDRHARTFDADVYSPRHPRAHENISHSDFIDLVKRVKAGQGKMVGLELSVDHDDLMKGGVNRLLSDEAFQNYYLVSKGIVIKPKMKDVAPSITKAMKYLKKHAKYESDYNSYNLRGESWFRNIADAHHAEEFEKWKALRDDFTEADLLKYGPYEEDGSLKEYLYDHLAREVESAHKNGGQDKYANREAVAKQFRKKEVNADFETFANEEMARISKGKRLVKYTSSGTARYSPYTLDNIVERMTEELRGGENFNYGAGSVRSAFAFEFQHNTIESIKAYKGKIVSKDEMNKVRDEANNKLAETLEELKKFYKYDAKSWGYANDASSAIAEGPKGWASAFKMNAQSKAIISELASYLRELPSEYFETKMQRGVALSEFSTAIVPKDLGAKAREALEKSGVKIVEYNNKNAGARSAAIAKQKDMLFQPAYHGSPHKFDKFSLAHMGSGEGVQAYGWGLYFAGNKAVAEYYRKTLTGETEGKHDQRMAAARIQRKRAKFWAEKGDAARAQEHEKNAAELEKEAGQLYKVDIPSDDTMLLWDKPLSEQPRKVQSALNSREVKAAIKKAGYGDADLLGNGIYRLLSEKKYGSAEAASKALHAFGINGIKFLDGSSRGAGDGNYNYVIFDDAAIEVLETFYQPPVYSKQSSIDRFLADDGIHPDMVADLFGFSSSESMLSALARAKNPAEEIERLTDELMLQRHADLATPAAREAAAEAAIHNEARTRFIATELAMLNRARGKPSLLMREAKAYADRIIAGTKISQLRPHLFEADEARAGKEAEKAQRKGDLKAAELAKRNQLLHSITARKTRDAQAEIAKALSRIERIEKAARTGKLRAETGEQVIALLARYDLRKSTSAKDAELGERSLAEFMASESERLQMPLPSLAEKVAQQGHKQSYKAMTMEEFRGLVDAVKMLEAVGRRENAMFQAVRNQTFVQEREAVLERMRQYWPKAFDENGEPVAVDDAPLDSTATRAKKKTAKLGMALLIPENVIDLLEGGEFGAIHESLFLRMSKQIDARDRMMKDLAAELQPFMDAYTWKEKRDFSGKDIGTARIGIPMSREQMVTVALLAGNPEGRERLANYSWGTNAMINKIIAQLDAKDVALANAVWRMFDVTLWPQLEALNKRTLGVAPPKVQAVPIATAHGELTGGYFPLRYDGDLDAKASNFSDDDALALMRNGIGRSAKTAQGTSQARVDGVKMRPLLTLQVMSKVAGETVHDIALREAVLDSARLVNDSRMQRAIQASMGMEAWRTLKTWVGDMAAPPHDPGGPLAGAANWARRNTVTALMSGVGTAVQNFTGIMPAMTRVHPGLLAKEIADVPHLLEKYRDTIDKSAYMRERFGNFERDLRSETKALSMKSGLVPDQSTWFALMAWVDRAVSVPVWQAAYREGAAKLGPEGDAVAYADHIVRATQGGGRMVDRARVMRGGALEQLFTMFHSYFNGQLNLLVRTGVLTAKDVQGGNKNKAVSRVAASAILVWILPAVITELTRQAPDDEDDEDKAARVARATVLYPFAMIPIARDMAPFVFDKVAGNQSFEPRFSPALSLGKTVVAGVEGAIDMAQGEANDKDIAAMLMGAGMAFNLPGVLMKDVVLGTKGLVEGQTDDWRAPVIGMPPQR